MFQIMSELYVCPGIYPERSFICILMNSHPYCHKLSWLDDIMKVILLLRYINKCLTYIFLKEIPHVLKLTNISETRAFYIDYSFAVNLQLEIFCFLIFWFLFVLSYFVASFPVPLDWLWIYCVNQAGFELLRIPLSHSPQHWDDFVCLTDKMSRNQFPLPNLYINWNYGHIWTNYCPINFNSAHSLQRCPNMIASFFFAYRKHTIFSFHISREIYLSFLRNKFWFM